MNQIATLFGDSHDSFLAKLRKATKRRAKRALVAKAVREIGRLLKLRKLEAALLNELRSRLRDCGEALEDGVDAKMAKTILGGK